MVYATQRVLKNNININISIKGMYYSDTTEVSLAQSAQ